MVIQVAQLELKKNVTRAHMHTKKEGGGGEKKEKERERAPTTSPSITV